MKYAQGTGIETRMPWGVIVAARALCPDGRVRRCSRVASTSDTFYSIPAAVQAYGKTVAGYITVETMQGFTTETKEDPAVVRFVPYTNRKNYAVFQPYIELKKGSAG